MDRKFAAMLVLASGSAIGQSAPLCAIYQSGGQPQCFYYNVQSCRMAAGPGGLCAMNPQQGQPQYQQAQAYHFDTSPIQIGQYVQQGYENGVRLRQEREEHEARMRVLEAQAAAAESQADASFRQSLYQCPQPDGTVLYKSIPCDAKP